MQGNRGWPGWEDFTYRRATKPVHHNQEPAHPSLRPQQEKPHNEKLTHRNQSHSPLTATKETHVQQSKTSGAAVNE